MMRRVIDTAELRRMHAAGLTDRNISNATGWAYHTVRQERRRLGLTPNDGRACEAFRQAARVFAKSQPDANRRKAFQTWIGRRRELAAMYGLPHDLTPVQVRIVVMLSSGPMTTKAIADAVRVRPNFVGLPFRRFNYKYRTVQGGNYLTDLRIRGLVWSVKTGTSATYSLTPLAMDLLTRAANGHGRDGAGDDAGGGEDRPPDAAAE